MIKVVKQNKDSVLDKIRKGEIDAVALSSSNLVDDIISAMFKNGILSCLGNVIPDKRKANSVIPFELILALATAAKMKVKTALTDVPFAIQDHKLLAELGYNIIDNDGIDKGIMTEGVLRHLLKKYEYQDFFKYYNDAVQNHIMPKQDLSANMHILDCTDIEVELSNDNYEKSEVVRNKYGVKSRGYKLSTLRGIVGNTGIIEEVRFSDIKVHDLALSEDMIRTSPMLKSEDMLINDRGFISRDLLNFLKTSREVDTYIPLKINMDAYKMAVSTAVLQDKWHPHPNKKRKTQMISFVSNLKDHWVSDNPKEDVNFNACVVWDTEPKSSDKEYFVFITTDLSKTAKQIIKTYELRPEIEESYRQIKDFWKLEDFQSTKINLISFHIMCVLFGYLFFELYTMMPEGEQYADKCLPVILKNYKSKNQGSLIFYVGDEFGIFTLVESMKLYASVDESVRIVLDSVMDSV